MARVNLEINGRKYTLGCDDGEEERLTRLGTKLDERISLLANQFGQIGDLRLLVMAGITLTDELEDHNNDVATQAAELSAEMEKDMAAKLAAAEKNEKLAIKNLNKAAEQIEKLTARLSELDN